MDFAKFAGQPTGNSAQRASEAAGAVVAVLDRLSIDDQEAVWWTVYRCIHDRYDLYGLWSDRLQATWAAVTLNGAETSAMSDALLAVIALVRIFENPDASEETRAQVARIAKAEDAVALARACLLIAQG